MAEFEDTRIIGAMDEYGPNKTGYAAIVDPEQTELNQAFLRYRGISKLDVIAGRQRFCWITSVLLAMWAGAKTSKP